MRRAIDGCYIPEQRRQRFADNATVEEVHEVLENRQHPPLWRPTKATGSSPAYLVYGRTVAGRYLLMPGVVFSEPPLKDVFMPMTVRDMTLKERQFYNERTEKG